MPIRSESPICSKVASLSRPASQSNLGEEMALNRINWAALCLIEKSDADRREAFYYQIGKKAGWCS